VEFGLSTELVVSAAVIGVTGRCGAGSNSNISDDSSKLLYSEPATYYHSPVMSGIGMVPVDTGESKLYMDGSETLFKYEM
jgi:hypothetical protein